MQINWFTVVAQILNFFLLVWLLKRFLYKPILKAIDDREGKITEQLKNAETKMAEAKKEQEEFEEKNNTFDQQKNELMDKAVADTKAEQEKLMQEVRSDAETLHAKLEKAYKETQSDKEHQLARKTEQEIFAVSRKALSDLANISLEEQVVAAFIDRLTDLKEEDKKSFTDAVKSKSKPVQIQSAFELSDKQQTDISKAVHQLLGEEMSIEFSIEPELISGIEVTANGYKMAWSIAAYLNSFESKISDSDEKPETESVKV